MVRFRKRGTKWLRVVHVICACVWIGGAVALLLMQTGLSAGNDGELYGIDHAMRHVDDYVIIPGALGCLITGILFSVFTGWGFLKYRWIIIKYAINIYAVLFGTFWLGPWLNQMGPISRIEGLAALSNPSYLHFKQMNISFGIMQVALLLAAVYLSVFKPWGKGSAGRDRPETKPEEYNPR